MAKLSISVLIATTVLCAGVLEASETQQDQHLNLRRRLQPDTIEEMEEMEEMEAMGLAAWENHDIYEDEDDRLIPEEVYNEQMASDPIENDEYGYDYYNRVTNEDEADIYIEDIYYSEAESEYQNDTRDSDEDSADPLENLVSEDEAEIPMEYPDYSDPVYNDQMPSDPNLFGIPDDAYAYDEDMVDVDDDEDDDAPNNRDAHQIGMSAEELYSDGN